MQNAKVRKWYLSWFCFFGADRQFLPLLLFIERSLFSDTASLHLFFISPLRLAPFPLHAPFLLFVLTHLPSLLDIYSPQSHSLQPVSGRVIEAMMIVNGVISGPSGTCCALGCVPGELATPGGQSIEPRLVRTTAVSFTPTCPLSLLFPTEAEAGERETDSFTGSEGERKGLSFQAGMRGVKMHRCEMELE